ncbi:protein HAPLESS 2 isoform X2 [Ipomoea triloba]|uniref:protein HAPLESS 2 isoform X2 n=1 Tax=Ipomoea triloba TaxID=35885 RepID=UPI00125CEB07|nr:protein HAPLESS 2 isoform X2 [Ipomoea triloba]
MKPLALAIFFAFYLSMQSVYSIQIISKSKLQKCEKASDSNQQLNCTNKIVIDLAVPSESSGNEASMVAEIVEVEEDATNMRTLRSPPVITVQKSSAYALYELTYIRDVAYKPEELYVKTRKCKRNAGSNVVRICERLRDENGNVIDHTQPICCPCGGQRRIPSSCGNFFDKMTKGKANTAHCLRFPGDWFHVFGIGHRSVGFSIRIEVKTRSQVSEVTVGPGNRTAASNDNFLRVNLVGDYVGYTDIPSFEDYYLVIPRQGGAGQPQNLGSNFSMWMLLERVRFTLDGLECNKIGVGFDAFNSQPDFCSAPFWSCLHNQLWNFWDADQNRIARNQVPLYCVQGRFERINQHPNAGNRAFSIGITEVLNTNLLIELSADDIEYVYQRSPGKIVDIIALTFEALTQLGTAKITTKNIGEVEASYSLTFDCSGGISLMEEQFYIMKPNELVTRAFKLNPSSDQAANYFCSAILKDSDFGEVDRAECQFTTTATVFDNGSQIPFQPPKSSIHGFFETIEELWNKLWEGLVDFLTGESCRRNCSGIFDVGCHVQYICMNWIVLVALFAAIFPTLIVLVWLLHQKGIFDPIYDWWEDHFSVPEGRRSSLKHHSNPHQLKLHLKKHHHKHHETRHHHHHHHKHQRGTTTRHPSGEADYRYYLHHVHKDSRHRRAKGGSSGIKKQVHAREHHNKGAVASSAYAFISQV